MGKQVPAAAAALAWPDGARFPRDGRLPPHAGARHRGDTLTPTPAKSSTAPAPRPLRAPAHPEVPGAAPGAPTPSWLRRVTARRRSPARPRGAQPHAPRSGRARQDRASPSPRRRCRGQERGAGSAGRAPWAERARRAPADPGVGSGLARGRALLFWKGAQRQSGAWEACIIAPAHTTPAPSQHEQPRAFMSNSIHPKFSKKTKKTASRWYAGLSCLGAHRCRWGNPSAQPPRRGDAPPIPRSGRPLRPPRDAGSQNPAPCLMTSRHAPGTGAEQRRCRAASSPAGGGGGAPRCRAPAVGPSRRAMHGSVPWPDPEQRPAPAITLRARARRCCRSPSESRPRPRVLAALGRNGEDGSSGGERHAALARFKFSLLVRPARAPSAGWRQREEGV